MIPTIIIVIAAIVIIFFIVVSKRPSEFCVKRSTTIGAPPALVYPHVNDLHKYQEWSPWSKLDPTAKLIYTGPVAGTGAGFSWAGNKKIGEGSLTIIESRLDSLIRFKLEFLKPFQASNTAEFTFKPAGSQTNVTWSMSGKNNFVFKVFGLFMDCDKMIGCQFEKGLASLKSIAENEAKN